MSDDLDAIENAIALYGKGDLDGAEAACDRILVASPGNGEAYNQKGLIAYRRGDPEAALDWFTKASAAPDASPNFFQ